MQTPRARFPIAVGVLALTLAGPASLKAAVRAWVATTGIDNALCSREQPCRTFTAAITAVDPGGEIVPVDSGGYGSFTITKSVTVVVPGGIQAAIAPTSGTAITVAAAASDRVTLRGLFLNNFGAGVSGIDFLSGGILHVRNCEVARFLNNLRVERSAPSETVELFVSDSVFRDGQHGVRLDHTGSDSVIYASINACQMANNGGGVWMLSRCIVTAHRVNASGGQTGFYNGGMGTSSLNLDHCVATFNAAFGLLAGPFTRMTSCSITHNATGVGGPVVSLGNNLVHGNGNDVSGTITVVPGK